MRTGRAVGIADDGPPGVGAISFDDCVDVEVVVVDAPGPPDIDTAPAFSPP